MILDNMVQENPHMYNTHDYDFDLINNMTLLNNRLFATFTPEESIDELVSSISKKYDIIYNKIFILHIKSNNEYVMTYNVDQGNISDIPENTILVHRKKEFNILYSLNALNELIKSLNGGTKNSNYDIDWSLYKNSILLTQNGSFKILQTKIYKIIEI